MGENADQNDVRSAICGSCRRPAIACGAADSATCQLAARVRELEDCEACLRCADHREETEVEDGPDKFALELAEARATAAAAMQAIADLYTLAAGARRLIERNGYCVACDRYAPWHLIDCVMLRLR